MGETSQLNAAEEISPLSVGQIYRLSNPLLRKPLTEWPSPEPKSIVGKNGRGVRSA